MHRNPCWPQAGQYWYGVLSDGKGIFYSSVLFLTLFFKSTSHVLSPVGSVSIFLCFFCCFVVYLSELLLLLVMNSEQTSYGMLTSNGKKARASCKG